MGKTRKPAKGAEEQETKFDVGARLAYITGFRDRKQARRKKARIEIIEKERQDKIEVKKDYREVIKKQWKDVMWAERSIDRLLQKRALMYQDRQQLSLEDGACGGGGGSLALRDSDDFDTGGNGWIPSVGDDDDEGPAVEVVSFKKEDDDPFGDCEVMTSAVVAHADGRCTVGGRRNPGQSDEEDDDQDDWGRTSSRALALRSEDCSDLALRGDTGKKMTPAEMEEHRRLRAMHLRKEERKRMVAIGKRLKNEDVEKKRMKPKAKKTKTKQGHNGKTSARTRRKRKSSRKK